MQFTRRNFLGAGLAGLGLLTLPRATRAAGSSRLIVVFARGGWDPVWSIDPKQSTDVDSPPDGAIKKFQNEKIPVLVAPTRPNIEAFFAAYANQCAVVRGIDVGSIAHFACHVRMMTGTRTELNPDLGMITAVTHGASLPLPYADIGGGAYAGAYGAQMGRLGNRNQVVTLLDRANAYKPAASLDYDTAPLLTPTAGDAAQIQAWLDGRATQLGQGRAALGDNARRLGDYRDCFARADALRGIPALQELPVGGSAALPGQIDLALTMLDGTSSAVYLDSRQDWDTHDNIADQGTAQDALFGDLALLMQRLGETGLASSTTVVVMSEMGRTPRLNSGAPTAGKDHWPVTSALVLGAGVKAGAYGGTDQLLNARKVDLATGMPDDADGLPLRYDNFAAGVLELVGVSAQEWIPDVTPFTGFHA